MMVFTSQYNTKLTGPSAKYLPKNVQWCNGEVYADLDGNTLKELIEKKSLNSLTDSERNSLTQKKVPNRRYSTKEEFERDKIRLCKELEEKTKKTAKDFIQVQDKVYLINDEKDEELFKTIQGKLENYELLNEREKGVLYNRALRNVLDGENPSTTNLDMIAMVYNEGRLVTHKQLANLNDRTLTAITGSLGLFSDPVVLDEHRAKRGKIGDDSRNKPKIPGT